MKLKPCIVLSGSLIVDMKIHYFHNDFLSFYNHFACLYYVLYLRVYLVYCECVMYFLRIQNAVSFRVGIES